MCAYGRVFRNFATRIGRLLKVLFRDPNLYAEGLGTHL